MSFNLAHDRGLVLDVIPAFHEGEIFIYGPVFFYLQSFLIKIFGLQHFIFRLPGLAAAYVSVLLLAGVLRHHEVSRLYSLLFVLAAVVDVSFNRNVVGGRMDMVAVMFVLLALYLASRQAAKPEAGACMRWLLVGGLSAVAYLTTPRALFLLPVVSVLALHRLFFDRNHPLRDGNWVGLIASVAAFVVPVWLWIQQLGGFQAYALLFANITATAEHIGPSFFRSSYDNIAIGLMIALCLLNYQTILKSALLAGMVLTYIAFSLFVKEAGPYSAMIMPFVLATNVLLIEKSKWPPIARYTVLGLIILPGTLLIALRGADVYLNADCP